MASKIKLLNRIVNAYVTDTSISVEVKLKNLRESAHESDIYDQTIMLIDLIGEHFNDVKDILSNTSSLRDVPDDNKIKLLKTLSTFYHARCAISHAPSEMDITRLGKIIKLLPELQEAVENIRNILGSQQFTFKMGCSTGK